MPHGPSAHANMLLNWFTAIGACTLPSRETREASRREQEQEGEEQPQCSRCLVQWHVRLLFAMGSWPAFANGVANTICGRPRLDVRPVRLWLWLSLVQFPSFACAGAELSPSAAAADEQMQCLIKHSDWFAAETDAL